MINSIFREMWRNKRLSIVMVLMVALPVALISGFVISYQSNDHATAHTRPVAEVDFAGTPCKQNASGAAFGCLNDDGEYRGTHNSDEELTYEQFLDRAAPALPEGFGLASGEQASLNLRSNTDTDSSLARYLSLDSTIAQDLNLTEDGIILSHQAASALGAKAGDVIDMAVRDNMANSYGPVTQRTIMGISPTFESFIAAAPTTDDSVSSMSLQGDRALTHEEIRALNSAGFTVSPREEILDEWTAEGDTIYPDFDASSASTTTESFSSTVNYGMPVATAAIIGLLILVLLIGPVFGISASRRRHDFSLMRAQGAPKKTIYRAVTAHAAIIGTIGAVLGVILGTAFVVIRWNLSFTGWGMVVPPVPLLITLVVAILTTVFAAMGPARVAANNDIIRSDSRNEMLVWDRSQWIGPILLVAGIVLYFVGASAGDRNNIGLLVILFSLVFVARPLMYLLTKIPGFRMSGRDLRRTYRRFTPVIAGVSIIMLLALGSHYSTMRSNAQISTPEADAIATNYLILSTPSFNNESLLPLSDWNGEAPKDYAGITTLEDGVTVAREELGDGDTIAFFTFITSNGSAIAPLDVNPERTAYCREISAASGEDGLLSRLRTDAEFAQQCSYTGILDSNGYYTSAENRNGGAVIAGADYLNLITMSDEDKQRAAEVLTNGGILAPTDHNANGVVEVTAGENTAEVEVASVLPSSWRELILSPEATQALDLTPTRVNVAVTSSLGDYAIRDKSRAVEFAFDGDRSFPQLKYDSLRTNAGVVIFLALLTLLVLAFAAGLNANESKRTFNQYFALGASRKDLRKMNAGGLFLVALAACIPAVLMASVHALIQRTDAITDAVGHVIQPADALDPAALVVPVVLLLIIVPLLAAGIGWLLTPRVTTDYRQN